jgi:pimeloyl-ACP methyl ester carboxylesterase
VGISSGAALALHAVASGLHVERLCLFDPPFVSRSLDDEKRRLEQLVASGDRKGAAKLFLAEIVRVPRFFLSVMPLLMRGTWKNNESVALTLPYDLALIADVSVLRAAIAVPTLVAAGAKSSPELREAAERVSRALPNATLRLLPGVGHDVPPAPLAQVLIEFAGAAREAA